MMLDPKRRAVLAEYQFTRLIAATKSVPVALTQLPPEVWRDAFAAMAAGRSGWFREALIFAWVYMINHLRQAFPERQEVVQLFEVAGLAAPPDLPELVRIWRGGCATSIDQLAALPSWTLDRGLACFYVTSHQARGTPGSPMLLSATVPRDAIVAWLDHNLEREVLLRAPPERVTLEGDAAEWHAAGEEAADRRQARWEQLFKTGQVTAFHLHGLRLLRQAGLDQRNGMPTLPLLSEPNR